MIGRFSFLYGFFMVFFFFYPGQCVCVSLSFRHTHAHTHARACNKILLTLCGVSSFPHERHNGPEKEKKNPVTFCGARGGTKGKYGVCVREGRGGGETLTFYFLFLFPPPPRIIFSLVL